MLATIIKNQMLLLGLSSAQTAALANVTPNRLNQYMNGVRDLDNAESLHVHQVLKNLEALSDYARPFEISWRDVGLVRRLLEDMKNGLLKTQILENISKL